MRRVVGPLVCTRDARVELHLVDVRYHARYVNQLLNVRRLEVRHADRSYLACLQQVDHAAPGIDETSLGRVGPVDQQEVDVVETESGQALFEACLYLVEAVPFEVELCRHEELGPVNP